MRYRRHGTMAITTDAMSRGSLVRMRIRVSIDMLVALATTALAVALALGYQLLRFGGPGGRASRP
jgi:hypothetical protein